MSVLKSIVLIAGVVLVFTDVSSRIWAWHHYAERSALLEHFKMEYMHTNDWSGVGIFDARTGHPIFVRWDVGQHGDSVLEEHYFEGHDVLDITLSSNKPPKYSVFFGGPGKSVTWWLDRLGSGSFTERIFYDTNGAPSKHEVWYDDKWQLVERRDGTNGLVINGDWHSFAVTDTNKTWTLQGVGTNRQ